MKLSVRLYFLTIFLVIIVSSCSEKQHNQPNIIFILADDQCFNTVNALGNNEIITPTLDKMVSDGVAFTHAYNMGGWSGAVCVASRSMMNTGLSIWNAKSQLQKLNEEDAGYETYMSGKWHVPVDASKIFNHTAHIRAGMPNQSKTRYERKFTPDSRDWKPYDKIFGGYWKGGRHWSEVVGDDATSFLGDAVKKDNPFFMYIAFNAPHDPRQSPIMKKWAVERI